MEAQGRNRSWQEPEPRLHRGSKGKPRTWKTRYRRYLADGSYEQPWEIFGDEEEFPTKANLKNSPKWHRFIERINSVRVVVSFRDLCRMYREEEIPKRVPHGQSSASGNLSYLEDKWGPMRLDQLIQSKYEIKNWLQGDLPLRSDPEKQASRQTRKHLRTLLVQMITYAVDKHYLAYNPFTGTALTVKKGGAPRADRSEFFVSPEQFRWMMNDPETPDHVKAMILLAYTCGMRTGEFLGLRWDEIEFDDAEPKIPILRSVHGRDINEFCKTETSRTPVPMCAAVAAHLLAYKQDHGSANGWVFESYTGRPVWADSLREDHLRPAFLRMAGIFKLRSVPEGAGFHAFRHAYNALILKVSSGADEEIRKVQMTLLRQSDERVNAGYGKSALPVRERARAAHTAVAALALEAKNE